jgi:hypothetical protein
MKVQNMTSSRGNAIANQFIITDNNGIYRAFQSYDSLIVEVKTIPHPTIKGGHKDVIKLDSKYWDYSRTTGKYRNQFLGETKKETQAKIDSGEYILTNLN